MATPTFKSGWPLPDEFLVELGRVSALWGTLESFLEVCIAKLSGFDDLNDMTWFVLVKHSSFQQKLDIFATLCNQLSPHAPNLQPYAHCVSKIKEAQKLRNRFLHNSIGKSEAGDSFHIAEGSARGKLKTSTQPITVNDLRDACAKIHVATLSLYKLVLKVDVKPVWERNK